GTSRWRWPARTATLRSWWRRRTSRARRSSARSAARRSPPSPAVRDALEAFLGELKAVRRGSVHTLAAYRRDVSRVLDLAAGAGRPVSAAQWDRALLERALRELFRAGHVAASSARALAAWRSFGRFCVRRGLLAADPAQALAFPRLPRRLPRTLPRVDLNDALDRLARVGDPAAARDLALLETTYSSGLRVSELVGLRRGDLGRGTRLVRLRGKGRKDRLPPLGERALAALDRYLAAAGRMAGPRDEPLFAGGALGRTRSGPGAPARPLSPRTVQRLVCRRLAEV